MANRTFTNQNFTPTATADTTALASGTYMAIKGGSSTQLNNIKEFRISGLASVTSPTLLNFAMSSTIGTTPTALAAPASDGPNHPATAALAAAPVTYTAASTGPQRSAVTTVPKINLALNAFGGIIRYNIETVPYSILGNTAALFGEAVMSAFTGGTVGAISADIVYESL